MFEVWLSIIEVSTVAEAIGSPTGHPGSPDPQDHCAGTGARLGHREAHSEFVRRCAGRRAGVPLSGPPSAGTAGLGTCRVARVRAGTDRQVLRADDTGAETAAARARELEPALVGRRAPYSERVTPCAHCESPGSACGRSSRDDESKMSSTVRSRFT